jgi:hypothetical protein
MSYHLENRMQQLQIATTSTDEIREMSVWEKWLELISSFPHPVENETTL